MTADKLLMLVYSIATGTPLAGGARCPIIPLRSLIVSRYVPDSLIVLI